MSEGRGPYPRSYVPVSIASGLRAAARRTPRKIALQQGERTYAYSELVNRVDRVASGASHRLRLGRGSHSAVLASNCLEFVEIVCGLAEAGVPPALINPRSTPEEVAFICNDAEARVLFVHPLQSDVAREADLRTVEKIIVIGSDYDAWLDECSSAHVSATDEFDPFCLPYTAGTTGVPKGVLLSHRSRTLTFLSMAAEYGCYGPRDRTLGVAPLFHGAGWAFSVAALFLGGYCAILPRFDPEQVLQSIAELKVTNLFLVPTHFQAIFALGERAMRKYDTSSLRTIISNAAPLSQVMKERIVAYFGDDVLFESYGSTEASIVSNLAPRDQLRKEQCVGLPAPCTEVRLLNENGTDVEPGEVGELFSRSPYLFSGYWNRAHEADRAFRDGWCTAGDLARQDEEGYLYIVDRKNDKIISGGVNIYPREIEETLVRHSGVEEAAVIGVPDEYWGETVHAVVVVRSGVSIDTGELDALCRRSLAGYKVPKGYEFVSSLPRNAAGKVLRRTLREKMAEQTAKSDSRRS